MLRVTMSSITLLVALGCSAPSSMGVDAGNDASTPTDGGAACAPDWLSATCSYRGYGTACPVTCGLPASCTFNVVVTWTGGYCCSGSGGTGTESYSCRCEGGVAVCPSRLRPGPDSPPTTTCEFCEARDTGPGDAGTDAT